MIQVSVPANYGVGLMLLAGAALRPLADRGVLFVGLCGVIDSALRNLFDTLGIDALTRFANQLPKHRIDDLYPLFVLIGASSGVARGLLNHVVADRAPSRHETAEPAALQGQTRFRTSVRRGGISRVVRKFSALSNERKTVPPIGSITLQ